MKNSPTRTKTAKTVATPVSTLTTVPPVATILGGMSPAQFFREYWHKKPLLIRQAKPGFTPFLTREALFDMAARDDVESRLVGRVKGKWTVQTGPFDSLPPPAQKIWTVLVQGVNLHDDNADRLLREFRFLPDARLDDLMISYATNGGGVGPHFDSYDVFLLQAHGERQWQIGPQTDNTLIEGAPLKLLKNFVAEQTMVLQPGDMLYLPPHYAHDGVAIGECMTYSIGFRAPPYQELGEAFLNFMSDTIDLPSRYADPDLKATEHPAEISKTMLKRVTTEINKMRFTAEDVRIFLGEYLSEPKATVFFEPPAKKLTPAKFEAAAFKRGVVLSRKTQMLYQDQTVFINGESFDAEEAELSTLTVLANNRKLEGAQLQAASEDVRESVYAWYCDGWLAPGA